VQCSFKPIQDFLPRKVNTQEKNLNVPYITNSAEEYVKLNPSVRTETDTERVVADALRQRALVEATRKAIIERNKSENSLLRPTISDNLFGDFSGGGISSNNPIVS
jgi:predicted component of type VI protein secretion system